MRMFAVKMLLTFFGKNWQGFCVQYVFNFEVFFTNDDISSEPTWPCLFDFLYEIHEELLCWPQVSCHTGIHRSRLSSMLKLFIMVKTPTGCLPCPATGLMKKDGLLGLPGCFPG